MKINIFAAVLSLVGALAVPSFSNAVTPENLRYVCQSQEIGSIEISVSTEQNNRHNSSIEIKRYDLNQNLVETRFQDYSSATNESENNFSASFYDNTLSLRIPPTHVDWKNHQNDCYVQSQLPGIWFGLNANSGEITSSDNIIITSELNPTATYNRIREGLYYVLRPFVNGRRCDNVSDSFHSKASIVCKSF